MGIADSILASREKGLKWLLGHRQPDGSIGPYEKGIGCYYRAPWSFAVTGRCREAAMLLQWIRTNMFSADGDFSGIYSRADYDAYYAYPNSNIIYGAHIMRQFDLSMGGMRFLLTLQDPDSGGFFNRRDQMDASGMQDVWNSSQAGLTCLVTGHVEEALATAAFLERVYDLQPDVKHRLYNVYSPSRGLVTDPVEGEEKPFVVDASKPAQYYFQPGIAAAFLCRVYMGTGEKKHLNLARKYIGFVEGCKHLYSAPQVCKVGWGAALLYQTTKEARYYHLAQNVAQYLVDHQFPEGYWLNIPSHRALPKVLEVTEEFVVHLDTILNALST